MEYKFICTDRQPPSAITEYLMNRYDQIAATLRTQIQRGQYAIGARLPGIRQLAAEFGASITTVQTACNQLQDEGLIEARSRSGLYVCPPRHANLAPPQTSVAPHAPVTLTPRALTAEVMRQSLNAENIPLGAAIPQANFLGLDLIQRLPQRGLRQLGHDLKYAVPPGLPALRQAIAQAHTARGMPTSPDTVVITNGCHEALVLALRCVTRPGDTVAIESPSYYGFLQAMQGLGLNILEIPNHPVTGLSLEALDFALSRWPIKALVVTPNFSNPMGSLMPSSHKAGLVNRLRTRGVVLIEDDIYGALNYQGARPDTCRHFDPAGDTVIQCSSVSKSLAPGLRIGWVISPRFNAELIEQKLLLNIATASHPQAVVAEILNSHRWAQHLQRIRPRHAQAMTRMQQAVATFFPEDTRISQPQGGFVLWIELAPTLDATALMRRAAAQQISITPGELFSVSGQFRHCIRLNTAVDWSPQVEAALAFLGQAARDPSLHTLSNAPKNPVRA